MFTPQTEAALAANLGAEAGQPWTIALTAEVYRELVFAARQWDAMRSGAKVPAGAAQLPANLGETWQFTAEGHVERKPPAPRLTPVGAGDGNTFAVG